MFTCLGCFLCLLLCLLNYCVMMFGCLICFVNCFSYVLFITCMLVSLIVAYCGICFAYMLLMLLIYCCFCWLCVIAVVYSFVLSVV